MATAYVQSKGIATSSGGTSQTVTLDAAVTSGGTIAGAITSSKSWQSTMGGMKGDGLFHCYEFQWENGPNSNIKMWVDDQLVLDVIRNTSADLTQNLGLGSNQNAVGDANGLSVTNGGVLTDWYTDYDDLAFSTTGRIGVL